MKTVALRTALIWRDEVMDDVVLEKPARVTVGSTGKPRFVVPDIGLPQDFAIVRPGNRGYLLTLGERMRGTICLEGKERDVAEFVRRGEGESVGGFRATPISGRDWGVIDLDESGDYKLFFQFVPIEDAQPFFTKPVQYAGLGGYLLSTLILMALFYVKGVSVDFTLFDSGTLAELAECAFRGFVLSSAALAVCGVVAWVILKHDPESQASLAFSIVLHAALVFMTWQLYDGSDPFVWPGSRTLTAQYLASRIEHHDDPPQKPVAAAQQGLAAPVAPEKPKVVKTRGDEGKASGEGDHRRTDIRNVKNDPVKPPPVALFEDHNAKTIDHVIDHNLNSALAKFDGVYGETRPGDAGAGHGHGTGVGDEAGIGFGTTRGGKGHGPGGSGHAEGDYVASHGDVDTGGLRAGGTCKHPPCGVRMHEVKVSVGEAGGEFDGLTAEEINRVVKSRAGLFRACYQKELNRSPGLGGKLVMHFVIGGDGLVKSARTAGGSLRNDGVESCVQRQIMNLHFPAKGGISNVNYPFIFEAGG